MAVNEEFVEKAMKFFDTESKYYIPDLKYEVFRHPLINGELKLIDKLPVLPQTKNHELTKKMTLRSDDTFVIGYPKSGTTYVEEIAWLINNNLDFQGAKDIMHWIRVTFVDVGYTQAFLDEIPSTRTFKSHLPLKYLPENVEKDSKVVYVMRNPKDLMVSMYYFAKSLKESKFTGTFEEMVEMILNGQYMYGYWWDHVDGYVNVPNVHIVEYETLLEKPVETVRLLAKFLDKEFTDDQIRQLLAFTSLKNMKESGNLNLEFLVDVNWFEKDMNFFRKGQVGNWREHFSDELSKKVDDAVEKHLKSKIKFNYGEATQAE